MEDGSGRRGVWNRSRQNSCGFLLKDGSGTKSSSEHAAERPQVVEASTVRHYYLKLDDITKRMDPPSWLQ